LSLTVFSSTVHRKQIPAAHLVRYIAQVCAHLMLEFDGVFEIGTCARCPGFNINGDASGRVETLGSEPSMLFEPDQ
jgi:hypothetical protein